MKTPDDAPLQFERAERGEEAPPLHLCGTCSAAIADLYFERSGKLVCLACRERLLAERERGSRATRFLRAALFGSLAALAGSLLWYGIGKLTGYEFSLVAIVIGLLVGGAVRKGSYARGGWAYQGLAMFLTYASIVSTYLPTIFEALAELPPPAVESTNAGATAPPRAGADEARDSAPSKPSAPAPASPETAPLDEPEIGPLGFAAGLLFIFALAFAAPFLAGFENFLGWIILAIGVWEAWRLNRRETLLFDGPFRLSGAPATAPSEPLPTPLAP
jgi:hypothetical protein